MSKRHFFSQQDANFISVEKQSDRQNKLWEAILVNGETRVAVNSISKGEKVVILYQFCVTVERMLCSWIRFKQAEAVEQ